MRAALLTLTALAAVALSHGHMHHGDPHNHDSHTGSHHHLDTEATGPITPTSALFPLSAVKLGPGSRMVSQQARNAQYLATLDSSRLACLFTSAANLTGTFSNPTCTPYDHPQYWGHYLGHWLSASALSIESGADANGTLTSKATEMVGVLAQVQAAWTSAGEPGFLFPYLPYVFPALAAGTNCAPICVPFYTYHKMLAGMLDQYNRVGNKQALAVAIDMATWAKAFVESVLSGAGGADAWQVALSTEWGGMNDGLYNLYRATGDTRWLTTAYYFNHYAWTSPLVAAVDELSNFHANTHIPEVIGDANGFALTGNATQAAIVQNFLDILYANHSYSTGGSNDYEWWHPPRTLGDSMNSQTEETCTQYNILKLNSNRFSWDGNVQYMDMYARQLYGGMIGNQATTGQWANTNSTGFHYMLPLGGGGLQKPWGDSAEGFPCCWGTSSEAFAGRHVENIYHEAVDHSGVYVQLFEPSTLQWPATGAVLTQETQYPVSTQYTSRITINTPAKGSGVFSLLLRVPAWATAANTATLNGSPLSQPVVPGSYLNVTRAWATGDVLEVYFPAAVRFEQLVDDRPAWQGVGALMYGDFLLAGVNTTEQYLSGVSAANVTSWATRDDDPTQLIFTLQYHSLCGDAPASMKAIPLANVQFESYTVYFHTDSAAGGSVGYNGTATTTLSGAAPNWATLDSASIVPNGPTQNIRSGDPDQINQAYLTTSILDTTHAIAGVSFSYQYVSGYGPSGRHVGANFTVLLLDQCSTAAKAIVYQSPELTLYPFDVDNTGYSPPQAVSVTLPTPVRVATPTRVAFVFYDNDRNVQLNLPMDVTVQWAT